MEVINISFIHLGLTFLLLIIPIIICRIYRIALCKDIIYATVRMTVQLVLIGFFLKYLFKVNNPILNFLWLLLMISIAVYSALNRSGMKISKIMWPTFLSFSLATLLVVFYLNTFIIRLDYVLDARYLIILGGMLLGNSLRGNIIGITTFYKSIQKDQKEFFYKLSLGATLEEAVLPYLRESIELALKPSLAAMATMGIVALPGMMTGVILGGVSPDIAIKYQIMIMMGIIVSTVISVVLTIILTKPICFTPYGILSSDIFQKDQD
ncbi:MAG: ABC transporter permease [Candidatus Omnitrophica bacterium]|nr:ABC transporter permease [Candidatus Omnitrophota bacterium]